MADGTGTRVIAWVALASGLTAIVGIVMVATSRPSSPDAAGAALSEMTERNVETMRRMYESLGEQQKELQRRLEEADRELETARRLLNEAKSVVPSPPGGVPPEPPPQRVVCHDLHGTVVAADNRQNVFVLSIGSKDKVEPGMEFEVRRKAELIGSIVVDKVFPNYASATRKPGSAAFSVRADDSCDVVPVGK